MGVIFHKGYYQDLGSVAKLESSATNTNLRCIFLHQHLFCTPELCFVHVFLIHVSFFLHSACLDYAEWPRYWMSFQIK